MSTPTPTFEDELLERVQAKALGMADDAVASLFNDPEAIKQSMTNLLVQNHATVLARILGLETDTWGEHGSRFKLPQASNSRSDIIGRLAPLETLASEATTEWLEANQAGIKKELVKCLDAMHKKIVATVKSRVEYQYERAIQQTLDKLIEERATRVATELLGTTLLREGDRHARMRKYETARRDRQSAIRAELQSLEPMP